MEVEMNIPRGINERLLWQAVVLKYLDPKDYSHQEIADILKIDRVAVTRILNRAMEEGVVRLLVDPPKNYRLERKLCSKFNLDDAWIVLSPFEERKKQTPE